MFKVFSISLVLGSLASLVLGSPLAPSNNKRWTYQKYYDIQGHRGGRANTVENTLPSFAWGIIHGATSLEMDNGITKDGYVVVWHDENIVASKCKDTAPVYENDPLYPYVGKYIANLTLAQLKTIDCGSERQHDFPLQLTYPGTRIATLREMFEFVECTGSEILYNIESKSNPAGFVNTTVAPEIFVNKQLYEFNLYGQLDKITYQSFDWRTIIMSKKIQPEIVTSALCDDTTVFPTAAGNTTGPSPWLAGLDITKFNGSDVGAKVSAAAASIKADILSPVSEAYASNASALDPTDQGYIQFTNLSMVQTAHRLGLQVKPWTVDRLSPVAQLINDFKVDGIITDWPYDVRRWAVHNGMGDKVAPFGDYDKVMKCLKQHNQVETPNMDKYKNYYPKDQ